jgi:hypothetical protein
MGGEPVTVEVCEKFHRDFCDKLAAHDVQAQRIEQRTIATEQAVTKIIEAQVSLAAASSAHSEALAEISESQKRTQANNEQASNNLKLATEAILENSKWQTWAQSNLTAQQNYRVKENWRLIGIVALFVTVLLGLKAAGITI